MKIAVLNGSPKGQKSGTLTSFQYAAKQMPAVEFNVIDISKRINTLERNDKEYANVIGQIREADGVLWLFPVYIYMVPSGIKRFIELVGRKGDVSIFVGKYTAAYSTSIHFFDTIAHNYLHAVMDDWNTRFTGSLSAAMDDITTDLGKRQLRSFLSNLVNCIVEQRPLPKAYSPMVTSDFKYEATAADGKPELTGKHILFVHDSEGDDTNLGQMVKQMKAQFDGSEAQEVNIRKMKLNGSCLGCLCCAFDNHCVYGDRDDIKKLYTELYPWADIIVFGGTVADRYLSARWKMVFDRRFMKTHQPLVTGKQIVWLVSGPLGQIQNLRTFLEADVQIGEANLAGIVTDECGDSQQIDAMIATVAKQAVSLSDDSLMMPTTFEALGGKKIFRDEIWGKLRFVFQGDHRYFKSHGFYDFPQKDYKTRLRTWLMMRLFSIPQVRAKVSKKLTDFSLNNLKKALGEEA